MLVRAMLLFTIGCFSSPLLCTETVLYVCTIEGKTSIESKKPKGCDTLKEYRYQKKEKPTSAQGLRPEEKRQLEILDRQWGMQQHAQQDRYAPLDACYYYQAVLNKALSYIATKKAQNMLIGPYEQAELGVIIEYAQKQVTYFCPK